MEATLKVKRYNPEAESKEPYYQDYRVEIESHFTVLDSLIKIREEIDGSLALRCSCRSAICGSCGMRINGQAGLACKAKMATAMSDRQAVVVEPMGNMPVIKDLVTDMDIHWDKVRQVEPWLRPEGPEPEGEYIATNSAMLDLAGTMACIMCGACVSDCTVLAVDKNFLGPAALAKAYRFAGDPRDDANQERLQKLSEYGGIWDCTRCNFCVEVCPKGVAPMDRIVQLREMAIEAGITNNVGSRHTYAFSSGVRTSGRLNEFSLLPKTVGIFNIKAMLQELPTALRFLRTGKLPWKHATPLHKPIPSIKRVRSIFRKVEKKGRK